MNVLFFCMNMNGRHGSVLHALEYGEYFARRGDSVKIATLVASEGNVRRAAREGIEIHHISRLPTMRYDLAYALHLVLYPAMLAAGLQCDKAISMSLSASELIEQIPPSPFWPQFDLIAALSREAVNAAQKKFGINPDLYSIVPNHIPLDFLAKSRLKNSWSEDLRRVCVVSNHYNEEVAALKDIVPFEIDYFGDKCGKSVEITPELLLGYDAIISIGKTVQYGLGLGIPVFEYDRFGGCGYVGASNLLAEEQSNFSGRGTGQKYSAAELAEKLLADYPKARKEAVALREIALERYALDKLIEKQLEAVNSKKIPHPRLKGDALLFANAALASLSYIINPPTPPGSWIVPDPA